MVKEFVKTETSLSPLSSHTIFVHFINDVSRIINVTCTFWLT
uniref:Uncharacterized protein n=1 Tax=Anguilla anguilla TaxID=7936 RepID=A0A0E9VHH5_ANGAN